MHLPDYRVPDGKHMTDDPYLHAPQLRGRITDPLASFFRTFQPSDIDEALRAAGRPADWRYSDEDREARRRAALAGRLGQDLWVFAYGSLMWDPAFVFAEVRTGRIAGYARRFCLSEDYARGSPDAPGLMAGLDHGPDCEGLAFRIAADIADRETEILWRREGLGSAYTPVFAPVATAQGEVDVLAFVADHASPVIFPDLTRDEQVRLIATGTGVLGSSREYLENIAAHFTALGIEDADVTGLLDAVREYGV
jgi:glutathione-specific gamma-glutamylcyclotransferase